MNHPGNDKGAGHLARPLVPFPGSAAAYLASASRRRSTRRDWARGL
jgi:hypothetical protein